MMGETIRAEAAASPEHDIILVDRPILDALGYLIAALRVTDRHVQADRMERLTALCLSWLPDYDLLFVTHLDPTIPTASGRDTDEEYRREVDRTIIDLVKTYATEAHVLRHDRAAEAFALTMAAFERR